MCTTTANGALKTFCATPVKDWKATSPPSMLVSDLRRDAICALVLLLEENCRLLLAPMRPDGVCGAALAAGVTGSTRVRLLGLSKVANM